MRMPALSRSWPRAGFLLHRLGRRRLARPTRSLQTMPWQMRPYGRSRRSVSCVGIKQLLAVDLVIRDRFLACRRYEPVDELLPKILLDVRVLVRIDEHYPVLVEQSLVALDE